MTKHQYVNLPVRRPNLPFSDAVLVNDTLYISGRIGIDPATGVAFYYGGWGVVASDWF